MLLLGYCFFCDCKNRFFFVNAKSFFTENEYLLEMSIVCGGKRGARCGVRGTGYELEIKN